ncbi:unnamed protein product [Mytilus coruscus]|uniref:Uncharacterized protein n=1 Tax=Mytilus coruscus TaxID=42192 RepID=A0A6J8BKC2_MYTCO|nr:unnamed protein product [Mytilus coruscus]
MRPCQSSCIQREGKRKFLVSCHLGKLELLPAVTEAYDLEKISEIPANQSLTGLDDVRVVYSIENLTTTKNSMYDKDGGWRSMISINIAYELKFDRQFNIKENQIRKKSGDNATILGNKITESAENNWWADGDSCDMWRATKSRRRVVIRRRKRQKRARPNTPHQPDDRTQGGEHTNAEELSIGNKLSSIDIDSGISKKLPTETFKECVIKKSKSMEPVFEVDGTKMRHSFTWRMGDECVSLERYVKVYTRIPEELYEAVKKGAIEEQADEDDEEKSIYEEEIKASQIGIDKTEIKSNLRILDEIIREEEEKTKAARLYTGDVGDAVDVTHDEKIREEEKRVVLPPVQPGSFYEDIDGTDDVSYDEKIGTRIGKAMKTKNM